jgi:hypothetical protein
VIHELRTYTLFPGVQAEYLKLSNNVGRPARGDRFGVLTGSWTTEFGPLNQYVHLWRYENPLERERMRAALAKDEAWTKQYLANSGGFISKQENKILYPVDGVPVTPPEGKGNVYELRTYTTKPRMANEWAKRFRDILPVRERYNKIVGLWTVDVGTLNQVIHLWAYTDLTHRAETRAALFRDPDWQAFLPTSAPLLMEQESIVLIPTETSPLA